ncbi:hypothetical protein JB92DRAFT_2831254 [Gautieria morchelliformis]|nr:hypothetical protein JB92DRAFT_2831254 [Gautieria morchelliformis]
MTGRYEKALSKLQELSCIERIGSHCDNILVGVLYELLVGELVHSDKEWWYFEDGTWQKDGGEYLWNIISETFVSFLRDDIPKDDIPVKDIIRYLGSSITTMRLMKAVSYKLGDPKFVGKLNSNIYNMQRISWLFSYKNPILRKKYNESMEFRAKIVVVANNALEVPDVEMEEKIFKYRKIFMAMILDEYSRFVKEGLNIPQYIKDKTSEYITLNNYVLKYIRTGLSSPGKNLQALDLYDNFKDWFRQSCPGRNIPLFTSFLTELRNEGYEEIYGLVKNVTCVFIDCE